MKNSSKNKQSFSANTKPSLTVGITTCYGEESILDTVKSIRASKGVGKFRFILIADRIPIKDAIKRELKKYDVELIENKVEGSQFKKKKQILALTDTDLIIFTNDDVLFDPNALSRVVKEFERNQKITLISINNQPLKPISFMESIVGVGTNIVNRIAKEWNGGDNYLSVIGRFEALRTGWIRRYFDLKEDVVSSDQYIYFENKKYGGFYKYLPEVSVYFRNPTSFGEHLRKSSRFQFSKSEMKRHFGYLDSDYKIPGFLLIKATLFEFLKKPIKFLLFLSIFIFTRVFKKSQAESLNPNWEVDVSTKSVGVIK